MFGALGVGIGATLLTQFLLPPAFLHYYGIARYGEWLVLSSTLSFLSQLNFGITTYASNELTMLNKRGEVARYRQLQGSTLALLMGISVLGIAISSLAFVVPLGRLLHLTTISPREVSFTAFFLGLQMMVNILAAYFNTLFMVVEQNHRNFNWASARRLSASLIVIPLACFRVPFSVLAAWQLGALVVVSLLSIWDLKRRLGDLPLGLGGANWQTAKSTLAPSGQFALIFTQQFLIFQAPMNILQWVLGPSAVVVFSISRTILSTARQVLQSITVSIAPEITFSFAERDMKKMLNIFHYSEKLVFTIIPVANLGAFLFSPILLAIWHKPQLFNPLVYGLMALTSGAMSMREHKQYFQFQTNTHKRLSIIVFFGNLLMLSVSVPFTMKFGLAGFMCVWLSSEVAQMGLIYHENKKLFHNDPSINLVPVFKLGLVMVVLLPVCAAAVQTAVPHSLAMVGAVAVGCTLVVAVVSYFTFGVKDVALVVWQRMRRRAEAEPVEA
jgi:O-antigen/teichoic acid export membrane protein